MVLVAVDVQRCIFHSFSSGVLKVILKFPEILIALLSVSLDIDYEEERP